MKTRALISCLAAIIIAFSSNARQLSLNEAQSIAAKYASVAGAKSPSMKYVSSNGATDNEYYVFNTEDGGFVIVSGDSEMTELVAYSDESHFDAGNKNMMSWLNSYAAYVKNLRNGSVKPNKKALVTATPVIEPLVKAKWGQEVPFYNLCPFDEDEQVNVPVGCVATSLSQIMNNYKWPEHPTVDENSVLIPHSYVHEKYGELTLTYSVYDWPNILDEYIVNENPDGSIEYDFTDEQALAVATLARDCGYVVNMDYTVDGSGANDFDIPYAIAKHFQYNTGLYYRDAMSHKDFIGKLYDEIVENGRPVSFGADSYEGGHQFIVDGFDTNNFVHVNWGWNGTGNGYFDIDAMNPTSDESFGFNYHQSFVTLEPERTKQAVVKTQRYLWMLADDTFMADGDTFGYRLDTEEVAQDGSFVIACWGLLNFNRVAYNGQITIALFDSEDNIIKTFDEITQEITEAEPLEYITEDEEGEIVPEFTIDGQLAGLEDGTYALRLVSKEDGYDNWQRIVSSEKITVTIADGMASLYVPKYAVNVDKITITGTPAYDEYLDFTINITNESDIVDSGAFYWEILNPEGETVKSGSEGIAFTLGAEYEAYVKEYINEFTYPVEGEYTFCITNFIGGDGRAFDLNGETSATFFLDLSSVDAALANKAVKITSDGHTVTVTGVDSDMIEVFDINGRCILKTTKTQFDLDTNGVYIVKVGNTVQKIVIVP